MNHIRSLLKSRKVVVAIATLIGAAVAEFGLKVDPAWVENITYLGLAIITGISVEDAAQKFGMPPSGAPKP